MPLYEALLQLQRTSCTDITYQRDSRITGKNGVQCTYEVSSALSPTTRRVAFRISS